MCIYIYIYDHWILPIESLRIGRGRRVPDSSNQISFLYGNDNDIYIYIYIYTYTHTHTQLHV